jgi:hypothetical protein
MPLPVGVLPARGVLIGSQGERQRFLLDRPEITVGRTPENLVRVVIQPNAVARRHFRLFVKDGAYLVEDLGSPSGIYLNGLTVRGATPLHVGDVVQVGGLRLYFEHRHDVQSDDFPTEDADVYADWLADRGDPRGEFIHYQLAAERLPVGDPKRAELETMSQAILERHELRCLGPLPAWVESWRFRHGFVSAVRMDPLVVFEDDFTALRQAQPLRVLAFLPAPPELWDRLATSPRLDGITQVVLPRYTQHLGLAARFGEGAEPPYYTPYEMG